MQSNRFENNAPDTDPELSESIRRGLAAVEDILWETLSDGHRIMVESALHLSRAGGKRFRPMFTLLSAQFGPEPENPQVALAGVVVELAHLASLYHDDVMDEAAVRRGAPSANAVWDNKIAILTGDYLFGHAFGLGARLGTEGVAVLSEGYRDLVAGQVRETAGPEQGDDPVEHYRRVAEGKTAALVALAGRFGAMFAGADPDDVERVRAFGVTVGMAFQIADDILDITATVEELGKRPGADVRDGVRTLPVLYALEEDGPEAARLRELLAPIPDECDIDEALTLLTNSPGMKRARDELRRYVDRASAQLSRLPAGPANDALADLVLSAVDRAA